MDAINDVKWQTLGESELYKNLSFYQGYQPSWRHDMETLYALPTTLCGESTSYWWFLLTKDQ